jgi:hypothetical protein
MGFNTSLVLMNDCLHGLKDDKDLGEKIEQAVLKLSVEKGPIDIIFGGYSGYFRAIETHHADGYVPILVGGNTGIVIKGASVGWSHDNPELDLLKRLADKHGFTLRRKPA